MNQFGVLSRAQLVIFSLLTVCATSCGIIKGDGTNGDKAAVKTLAGRTTEVFSFPSGIAVDADKNVYLADEYHHLIRKITPAGAVLTLAGTGSVGAANGTGTSASFNYPCGLTVDSSGTVYVADTGNNLIRKIAPNGVVTTLAGGSSGSDDGIGALSSFASPTGVAVDATGNVYVADTDNSLIRKITPAGAVTTLAGTGHVGSANGTGTSASFASPFGIAVDLPGNIYVADTGNNLIRKITANGVVTTLAGSGAAGSANGVGTAASLNDPRGVAVDSAGNVYVADKDNNLIRKISVSGMVTTLAGSGSMGSDDGTGAATTASFFGPDGVAVDSFGTVYVADTDNNMVRQISQ